MMNHNLLLKLLLTTLFILSAEIESVLAQERAENSAYRDREENRQDLSWLSIQANVDSFYVVIKDDFDNALHVGNYDTLRIRTGNQTIPLVKKYYWDVETGELVQQQYLNENGTEAFQDLEINPQNGNLMLIGYNHLLTLSVDEN